MCFVPCSSTYLFHVAESFLRNWYVLSYSRNYHHFMEPGGILPNSQQPANCPCSEPHRPSPCPIISLFYDPFYYYPPIYALVFQVVSFPQVSPPKPYIAPFLPYTCYLPCPSQSSWFDHLNSIWCGVQSVKLLVM